MTRYVSTGQGFSRMGMVATGIAAMIAGAAFTAGTANADSFFKGKTIQLTVGSAAGGGYDAYTRLLGRHISRHIDGAPATRVVNMPGGGGNRAALYIYQVAANDGTEIGNVRASSALDSILGIRGTEMDFLKFVWIGSMASDTDVCSFWKGSGINSFEDMLNKPSTVGATGRSAQAFMFPNAINNVLGTKMEIILGYKGTGDRVVALEQGEIMGSCGINGSTLMSRVTAPIESGNLIPVVQSGLSPHPKLKDVPLTQSFAKTEEQRDILTTIFSQMAIARPYTAPPGLSPERTALLRTAFDNALSDPELLQEADKLRLEISPTDGKGTAAVIERMAAMTPELRTKVRNAMQQ